MATGFAPLDRCLNGPAPLVAENDNQPNTKMLCGILDTPENGIIHNIARYPYDKKIAHTLVKNDFGRDPGIGTPKNNGKRHLAPLDLLSPLNALIRMDRTSPGISLVTLEKPLNGLVYI
jgi:hypothetical protein